jgi:hypothetical protein
MQVANAVIPSGFAETASGIWVKAERSPDGPSGLGLTGVHGQKIADPGYIGSVRYCNLNFVTGESGVFTVILSEARDLNIITVGYRLDPSLRSG